MSFVAIQHLQQEQVAPVKDRRSLREIQAEEHALQEEADFLKWWTAEEERVQQEALALAQLENASNQKPSSRKKGYSKKKAETSTAGASQTEPMNPRRRPPKARQTPA